MVHLESSRIHRGEDLVPNFFLLITAAPPDACCRPASTLRLLQRPRLSLQRRLPSSALQFFAPPINPVRLAWSLGHHSPSPRPAPRRPPQAVTRPLIQCLTLPGRLERRPSAPLQQLLAGWCDNCSASGEPATPIQRAGTQAVAEVMEFSLQLPCLLFSYTIFN